MHSFNQADTVNDSETDLMKTLNNPKRMPKNIYIYYSYPFYAHASASGPPQQLSLSVGGAATTKKHNNDDTSLDSDHPVTPIQPPPSLSENLN